MKSKRKTIYDVVELLNKVFSPGSTKFSDYVKETSDDNFFLRTAFCKKQSKLENREISDKVTHVVVGCNHYIREENLRCQFTSDPFEFEETLTKMQISFVNVVAIEDTVKWNREVGYPICIIVPLGYNPDNYTY